MVQFTLKAQANPEVLTKIMFAETSPIISKEIKEKAAKFWKDRKNEKQSMLESGVEVEKAAMNKGYNLAIASVSRNCQFCEKWNTKIKTCKNPNLARCSKDAFCFNIKKTAANGGVEVTFPFAKNPESFIISADKLDTRVNT